ncbi:hypothetical protein ABZP36_009627 [Zizania latifolia]
MEQQAAGAAAPLSSISNNTNSSRSTSESHPFYDGANNAGETTMPAPPLFTGSLSVVAAAAPGGAGGKQQQQQLLPAPQPHRETPQEPRAGEFMRKPYREAGGGATEQEALAAAAPPPTAPAAMLAVGPNSVAAFWKQSAWTTFGCAGAANTVQAPLQFTPSGSSFPTGAMMADNNLGMLAALNAYGRSGGEHQQEGQPQEQMDHRR